MVAALEMVRARRDLLVFDLTNKPTRDGLVMAFNFWTEARVFVILFWSFFVASLSFFVSFFVAFPLCSMAGRTLPPPF